MPYSHLAGLDSLNNPQNYFNDLGWNYEEHKIKNRYGTHSIYIAKVRK